MTLVSSFWQGVSRGKIRKGSPQRNVPDEGGVGFSAIFNQYVVIKLSRKRGILDTKLLWDGNRKPYASYRMMSLTMTLSELYSLQPHCSYINRANVRLPSRSYPKLSENVYIWHFYH